MSQDSEQTKPLVRSVQVSPLPIGSGGSNSTKQQLNDINVNLTAMMAQSNADQKYDPPVPKPVTSQTITEQFCSINDIPPSTIIAVVGVLFVVYGICTK